MVELRMYFLVAYNLSSIQKGIQAGHAALNLVHEMEDYDKELISDFVENHKTWVILDGGTTGKSGDLQTYLDALEEDGTTPFGTFYEPDLNDALTAICFIADEKVWNKKDYPDFRQWLKKTTHADISDDISDDVLTVLNPFLYEEWVNVIGGKSNLLKRQLISGRKLAI